MMRPARPRPSMTQWRGSSKVNSFVTFTNTLQWMASGRPGANSASTRLFSLLQGRGEWP